MNQIPDPPLNVTATDEVVPQPQPQIPTAASPPTRWGSIWCHALVLALLMFWGRGVSWPRFIQQPYQTTVGSGVSPALVMTEGDPYVRALMRTISVSEANGSSPYSMLYGGSHVSDLSRHPNRCIPIVIGPNAGNCSTAAGRYQFLNVTWWEKAQRYHPKRPGWFGGGTYSFEPEFQDAVVYAWLTDKSAWGADIPSLLRQGKIHTVLRMLSGTWTSLGYGIETNSLSASLPNVYQVLLQEELGR
ncbi:MAG: glycoside hydrolase family protein [Synechococcales bacterium]|nr:glycoside hydrolase family protein [Synechococcales bacterium]